MLAASAWAEPPAPAVAGTTVTYALGEGDEQSTVTLMALGEGLYVVEGLPVPGTVLFKPATAEIAYQHPSEVGWLLASAADITPPPPPAQAVPGAPWQPWGGMATRRWDVRIPQAAADGTTQKCPSVFASAGLGAQTGVSVGALQGVFNTLVWLNAGVLPAECMASWWPETVSAQAGLPVRWHSVVGALVLKSAERVAEVPAEYAGLAWPAQAMHVDAEARVRLLLVQFAPEQRAAFVREHGRLPTQRQIDLLAEMLAAEASMP